MELALEGHAQIAGASPGLRLAQQHPEFLATPVLEGDTEVDGLGASIYGSVVREDGLFRMWYQAWPSDWDGTDSVAVGCAESDDGLVWRKPRRGLVPHRGSRDNHLCDLPFHSPSVLVDPTALPEARYRAFGHTDPAKVSAYDVALSRRGYYTAASADGFHWRVDTAPLWPHADVITAVWDPQNGCARLCLKWNGLCKGLHRRRFFEATWAGGRASAPRAALFPDELDDHHARERGFASADYYGAGLLPAGAAMVGFLWNFRHLHPLGHKDRPGMVYGHRGQVDLSLVYQLERGGRWLHLPGRPDWVAAADAPEWARGALYTASSPLHVGEETWLYITGTRDWHGWAGVGQDIRSWRQGLAAAGGFARIGLLRWPRNRIAGFRADRRERLVLEATPGAAGPIVQGTATGSGAPRSSRPESAESGAPQSGGPEAAAPGLFLNVTTHPTGSVRVVLTGADHEPLPGYGLEDCDPISGSHLRTCVRWRGRADLPRRAEHESLYAVVEMKAAELYAFAFRRRM